MICESCDVHTAHSAQLRPRRRCLLVSHMPLAHFCRRAAYRSKCCVSRSAPLYYITFHHACDDEVCFRCACSDCLKCSLCCRCSLCNCCRESEARPRTDCRRHGGDRSRNCRRRFTACRRGGRARERRGRRPHRRHLQPRREDRGRLPREGGDGPPRGQGGLGPDRDPGRCAGPASHAKLRGAMDSVSDFESGGCGFESRRSCWSLRAISPRQACRAQNASATASDCIPRSRSTGGPCGPSR